jgi:predicted nucleic acid-binding protein
MDVLIAATASLGNATLVHRDPHFVAIPSSLLKQEVLPAQ